MDVAKFRLGTAAILAALALASVASSAEKSPQAATQKLPRPAERPQLRGLNNPALKLTDSQKARIQTIMEGYLAESLVLNQQYAVQDAKPGADASAVRKQSRERMMTAVEQVLDNSQRKTLKEALAAEVAQAAQTARAGLPPIIADSKLPAR